MNRSIPTLVGSGRSLQAGLLANTLNTGGHRSVLQQRARAKAEKDSSQRYHVSGWNVTPETATLLLQHHGNSHGLQCGGLYYPTDVGSMAFSPSVADFLGQPATQGSCAAS